MLKILKMDFSKEFNYLLFISGLVSGFILVLSFFDDASFSLSPVCLSISQYNTECSLCGMTRAFVAISNFDFGSAWTLNRAAIGLYLFFLINIFFALRRAFILISKQK
ncbi:MAG: DUF2752 domain-containing protein [Ignavibacteriaceae bacterium]|nr:DUF2752 domain-containing protein [Ignavibacteriaceae bacterium]